MTERGTRTSVLPLLLLLPVLLVLPPPSGSLAQEPLPEIPWLNSLDTAKKTARAEAKPILVVIIDPGSRDSERLLRDLEKNRRIRALLPQFVCVRLDRARNAELTEKYGLKYSPSTLFLTLLGSPIKLISGPVSAGRYAAQMEEALAKHQEMWRPKRREPPKPRRAGATVEDVPHPRHAPFCPVDCEPCESAIGSALAWLVRQQRPDGRLEKPEGERVLTNEDGKLVTRSIDHIDVALTSFAGMAFLAEGSNRKAGPLRREVAKAAEFVAGAVRDDGIVSNKAGHDYLYLAHCNFETPLAAWFLAEVVRSDPEPDPALSAKLARVARYLMDAEDPASGAWGYSYDFREHDAWTRRGWRLLATTQIALAALTACRDAGIEVREDVLGRAVRYVLACQARDGQFAYRAELRGMPGDPGTTAASLFVLSRSGLVPASRLDALRARYRPRLAEIDHYGEHWWWFLWFTGLALADDSEGGRREFDATFRDVLLHRQQPDGSYVDPDGNGGSVLATAVAAIAVTLPLLPSAGARAEREDPIDVVAEPEYLKPPHDLSRVKVFRHGEGYRYDLVVSVDGEPGDAYLEALARGVVGANRTIYDVTDGQMTLNRAEIRIRGERRDDADVIIGAAFRDAEQNPRPFAHGITRVSKRTRIVNGREEEGLRIGDFILFPLGEDGRAGPIRWDDPRFVHVLAHELGHYLLGELDEYDPMTGESHCDCLMGRRRWTELCTDAVHSDSRTKESCWAHAKALYPGLVVPDVPDPGPWSPPRPAVEIVR